MPSANGVYSLPPGYLAVTGATIVASQHNPPLEDIGQALTLRLSRDGTAPMTGALQLASGNVGAPGAVFSVDASSGLYKTTAGIGVAIGGVKTVEFTAAGIASGAFLIGMLFPYTGSTAPSSLWVFPVGQTLLRAAYPVLWTFAQAEIAAGNTFYNNGDGITNFGIGDLRGRVAAAKDNMGGTAANRINNIISNALGSVGGEQQHLLTANEMPSHYHSAGIYDPTHGHSFSAPSIAGGNNNNGGGGGAFAAMNSSLGGYNDNPSATGVRVNSSNGLDTTYSAGGGGVHNNIQPTMVTNYILFAGGPT